MRLRNGHRYFWRASEMSAFTDRPEPSAREAVDKVFELARELTGCLPPDERAEWLDWIAEVRASLRGGRSERSTFVGRFEVKLAELVADTPVDAWAVQVYLVSQVRARLPEIADPHPSVDEDGVKYLRWAVGDRLFDVEFAADGDVCWFRRGPGLLAHGRAASTAELLEKIEETFAPGGSDE